MSILHKMNVSTKSAQFRREEDPYGVKLEMHHYADSLRPEQFNGFTHEQAYITNVRLQTMWYANQAQFDGRKKIAEKELLYFMYGPIIHRFNELRARSADRDWREVHRILDEIQKELTE